jgi:hypothetical protein
MANAEQTSKLQVLKLIIDLIRKSYLLFIVNDVSGFIYREKITVKLLLNF